MGIVARTAELLRALSLPRGFAVCELGNQMLTCASPPVVAETFYRGLGCGRYVSIDGNGRGTLVADLNEPLPAEMAGAFDLATDFGTGEHIFDQAQVWRSLHDLVRPGGFIVFDRPASGYDKHSFYNIHEMLVRDLAAANGYALVRLEREPGRKGDMLRGVMQLGDSPAPFQVPQQGRYHATLAPLGKTA